MSAIVAAARARRTWITALLLTVLLAACSGATSEAPSATPAPTPEPTATPVDVAGVFLAIVSQPDFSAEVTLEGTLEMGVTATLTGTMSGTGDDSRTLVKIDVAGTTTETETITVDGFSYTRTAPGPWLEDPAGPTAPTASAPAGPAAADVTLATWLRRLSAIDDLGVVTKNGQMLHHLSVGDEPVPPAALGLDPSMFIDPVLTIEFYARDDGTPAIFTIEGSWTEPIGGQDIKVDLAMDMILSRIGAPVSIKAPRDVWVTYESPLGYSMSHPDAVTVENRDGYDAYLQDGFELIWVEPWPDAGGLSAEGFSDALVEVNGSWGELASVSATTPLAGEPAYLARYEFTYDDGSPGTAFDVTAMHANVGWEITLNTVPDFERLDLTLLKKYIATFQYDD